MSTVQLGQQIAYRMQRPHLSSDAPVHTSTSQLEKSTEDSVIAADSMSMGEQQESHQCSYNTSSPHNHNRRSVSKLKQLRIASRGNSLKLSDVSHINLQFEGDCQVAQLVMDATKVHFYSSLHHFFPSFL